MSISRYSKLKLYETTKIIQFTKRNEKILSVLVAAIFMILAQFHINATTFLGDAEYYWSLSQYILDLSFPEAYRGYFYPMLLAPARLLFDTIPRIGYSAFYVIQTLFFSFVLAILLPNIFVSLIGGKASFIRRLFTPACVAIFFPGLIAYPLSDLPAICLIITSLALIVYASKQHSLLCGIALALFSGVASYGAYNTRTIYLFTIALLIFLIPTLILREKRAIIRIALTSFFIIGVILTSIPQSLINLKHLNTPTPFVIANFNNTSLFANQLKWGITVQRYETGYTPESGAIFPIYYVDPVGEHVFNKHNIGTAYATIPWYLGILASEPMYFLRIYTKHFFNGLDIRDGDPYTTTRSKENDYLSISSISISILGLLIFFHLVFKQSDFHEVGMTRDKFSRAVWALIILLPVFAILPGAIETRFFLPLHLMAYCSIAFGTFTQNINYLPKKMAILTVVIYLAIVAIAYDSAKESISNPVYEVPKDYIK